MAVPTVPERAEILEVVAGQLPLGTAEQRLATLSAVAGRSLRCRTVWDVASTSCTALDVFS